MLVSVSVSVNTSTQFYTNHLLVSVSVMVSSSVNTPLLLVGLLLFRMLRLLSQSRLVFLSSA